MPWERRGRIYVPGREGASVARPERPPWMFSHAANPFAARVDGDRFRIYFSSRDDRSRSSVGWVEADLTDTSGAVALSPAPIVGPGERGAFDDSGTSLGCIVTVGDKRFLYYVGWNLGVTVPWRNSIGLAISEAGGPFVKVSAAPIVDRSDVDPYSLSYPWVIAGSTAPPSDAGDEVRGTPWRMWYGSTESWGPGDTEMVHSIKYALSSDGVRWRPTGDVCIRGEAPETCFSRPCVVIEGGRYRMWFSCRGERYRIGYAESEDGIHWVRGSGDLGLEPAGSGAGSEPAIGAGDAGSWDADSVAYPHVFNHRDRLHMLYCGNDFGATGFGLAVRTD